MDVALSNSNGLAVIRLKGKFDFSACRKFTEARDQALADRGREIQVNLSGIDYMDSAALGMLLILREKASQAGKTVSLADCQGAARRIIEIANFDRLFDIGHARPPRTTRSLATGPGH